MRNLFPSASLLLAGMLLATAASATDPVYKWKDSSGHSHYSQSPPEGQKYQTITPAGTTVDNASSAPPPPVAAPKAEDVAPTAPTPAQIVRKKNCDTARANINTLNTHATVISDVNGDGKPVTLNVAQHNAALIEAGRQVDLYCTQ